MANSKYTPEQASALVASDEPMFILRAKDALSVQVIAFYKRCLLDRSKDNFEDASKIRNVEKQFEQWQKDNKDKVQLPTL